MLKISRKQLTERARHTLARASRNSHAQNTRRHTIARSVHPRLRGTRSPKPLWPRGAEDPEFAYKRPVSAECFCLLLLSSFAVLSTVLDQNHTPTHIRLIFSVRLVLGDARERTGRVRSRRNESVT